ncbi:MAG: hypothetical protein WCA46_11765 [Actinocatenispora sp.]
MGRLLDLVRRLVRRRRDGDVPAEGSYTVRDARRRDQETLARWDTHTDTNRFH